MDVIAGVMAVLDAGADLKKATAETIGLGGWPEFLAADNRGMADAVRAGHGRVAAAERPAG